MGYPVLGTVDDLFTYAREHRVDDVIVSLPWSAEKRMPEIVSKLKELPVHIRLGSDMAGFMYPRGSYSVLGGVTTMDVVSKPLSGWKVVVKYLEDKSLASLLLILFSPLMALIALAIRLESGGPILFRQPRYGFNNQVFSVYKFRTMYNGRSNGTGAPDVRWDDPRVTRVGRFLRRMRLDELPQLFNVLGGTMSLVGPRPHEVAHNEAYGKPVGGYFSRHRVKPGITGWAQVDGLAGEWNSPERMKARVDHDIYYIEHWSLVLDLQIMLKTIYVVYFHKRAH
jgi:Undecaprenyl-phosphate glucose phosphotransferase